MCPRLILGPLACWVVLAPGITISLAPTHISVVDGHSILNPWDTCNPKSRNRWAFYLRRSVVILQVSWSLTTTKESTTESKARFSVYITVNYEDMN